MSRKKNLLVIYLEFLPFLLAYRLLHLLPLRRAYGLCAVCFRIFYFCDFRHRRRCKQHIRHSGILHDSREISRLARASYREFSKLFVEIVKFDQCYSPEKIFPAGDPEGCELMFGSHPEPVIIVTAHYGNWEVAGTAVAERQGIPLTSIMRKFDNPLIGEMILRHRRGDMHELIDKNGGIRNILRALRHHRSVAILADQHASPDEGVTVPFFDQPAHTHISPALLHLKTGVPIVPELTRRRNDNFEFELVTGRPIRYLPTGDKNADVLQVTKAYTKALEEMIRQCPEQWLWVHRRWNNINR